MGHSGVKSRSIRNAATSERIKLPPVFRTPYLGKRQGIIATGEARNATGDALTGGVGDSVSPGDYQMAPPANLFLQFNLFEISRVHVHLAVNKIVFDEKIAQHGKVFFRLEPARIIHRHLFTDKIQQFFSGLVFG